MKTKYIHQRVYLEGHLQSHGGTTTAYQVDDDGYVYASAKAHCHPNDNYNKAQGRAKATGRLQSAHYANYYTPPITEDMLFARVAVQNNRVFP
jgi:hypothetical protein